MQDVRVFVWFQELKVYNMEKFCVWFKTCTKGREQKKIGFITKIGVMNALVSMEVHDARITDINSSWFDYMLMIYC